MPAAPWFQAAETALKTVSSCRPLSPTETPTKLVEDAVQAAGLRCGFWMYDLVLEQPGWVPPPLVAVQPKLFE